MANTFFPIASTTVANTSTNTVTISNINQDYTDLMLRMCTRFIVVGAWSYNLYVRFNGSSSNYTSTYLTGSSSGTPSSSKYNSATGYLVLDGLISGNDATNTFGYSELYIPNYTQSNFKPVYAQGASEANTTTNGTVYRSIIAGLWSDNSAISSITIDFAGHGTMKFDEGSSFHLYGIKKS